MKPSIRTENQTKKWKKVFSDHGELYVLIAKARYDDSCRNGHNSFGLTAALWRANPQGLLLGRNCLACGCLHDEITKHIPELAPYIKWHLTSSDGPLDYIGNVSYWAGRRGWCDGKPGSPPNLDYARSTAVWPDATDEELTAPGLEDRLRARLPKLLKDFQTAMEQLGFTY